MSVATAFHPKSLKEALTLLGDRDINPLPLAGCTDWMVHGLGDTGKPRAVLDLLRIPELQGISLDGGVITIGAATSFSALKNSPLIQAHLPTLSEVSGTIGAWQIQNRATIGGNIANASPAGDSLPVLLSLGAKIVIAGAKGTRNVSYDKMHLAYRKTALKPGELIVSIRIPTPPTSAFMALKKVGTREAQAISKVIVSFYGERDGQALGSVRIGAGSVAAIPVRLTATEALLEGAPLTPALAAKAAATARGEVKPIDDVRSDAAYRQYVLGQVVQRMVLQAIPSK